MLVKTIFFCKVIVQNIFFWWNNIFFNLDKSKNKYIKGLIRCFQQGTCVDFFFQGFFLAGGDASKGWQATTDEAPVLNVQACHSIPLANDPGWDSGLMSSCCSRSLTKTHRNPKSQFSTGTVDFVLRIFSHHRRIGPHWKWSLICLSVTSYDKRNIWWWSSVAVGGRYSIW